MTVVMFQLHPPPFSTDGVLFGFLSIILDRSLVRNDLLPQTDAHTRTLLPLVVQLPTQRRTIATFVGLWRMFRGFGHSTKMHLAQVSCDTNCRFANKETRNVKTENSSPREVHAPQFVRLEL